jgi:hypothetical protein
MWPTAKGGNAGSPILDGGKELSVWTNQISSYVDHLQGDEAMRWRPKARRCGTEWWAIMNIDLLMGNRRMGPGFGSIP